MEQTISPDGAVFLEHLIPPKSLDFHNYVVPSRAIDHFGHQTAETVLDLNRESYWALLSLLLANISHFRPDQQRIEDQAPCARGGLAPWQKRRVETFIDDHLGHPIGLADLAAAAALSPSYFCRAFKVSFGSTPFGHVTKCRIDRARDLLRDSDMPIAEIALVCGFAEQSNFTKVFGRLTGTPPGAWRRLNRD